MSGYWIKNVLLFLAFVVAFQIIEKVGRFLGREEAIRDVARKDPDALAAVEEQGNYILEMDDGEDAYCEFCGNLGTIQCECGDDLCVCANNGEIPCPECG